MRLLRMVVLIRALGALLLPGCSPAEAICRHADLVAPHLKSPGHYARVADNTPWLTWEMKAVTYPSPGAPVTCHPEKYRVSISTGPAFTDELGREVTPMEVTGGWTSPALENGKTYRWNVTAISDGLPGPTSVTRIFLVGSDCTQDQLQSPVLLEPANNSIVHTTTPSFRWDTTMTCLPKGYYLFYHERDVPPPQWPPCCILAPDLSGELDDIGTDLKDCTFYNWWVHAYIEPPAGKSYIFGAGPPSEVREFQVVLPGSTCFELGMTAVPTSTATPVPLGEKPWEVLANANCRACPSGACNEIGFAPTGYMATIEGRNEDATWFRIKDPNGVACWVWGGALKVPADAMSRSLLSYPTAPPVEAPPVQVNCARFKDIRTCIGNPSCTWDRAKQACVQK